MYFCALLHDLLDLGSLTFNSKRLYSGLETELESIAFIFKRETAEFFGSRSFEGIDDGV
jgi:hypothetical protein